MQSNLVHYFVSMETQFEYVYENEIYNLLTKLVMNETY